MRSSLIKLAADLRTPPQWGNMSIAQSQQVWSTIGVWRSLDSASDWGSEGRWFKSSHPDLKRKALRNNELRRAFLLRATGVYPGVLKGLRATHVQPAGAIRSTSRGALILRASRSLPVKHILIFSPSRICRSLHSELASPVTRG